jgi:NDP-sugar pyrophosphorylase family protein
MKPTLVIMAAGMGSRYGGLKQMDPVGPNGETLLEYSIHDAICAGFGKVIFVIRTDFEIEFKEQVGNRFTDKIEVGYAFQALENLPEGFSIPEGRTKPWGTGQAVLACKDVVKEPFAVQNADDFYGAEAYQTIANEFAVMPEGDSCMVGYLTRNTLSENGYVSRGICGTTDGYLSSIVERTHIETNTSGTIQFIEDDVATNMTGDEICSMNFWGFSPSFFQTLEEKFIAFLKEQGQELKSEWYIPSIVDDMITRSQTRVKVLSSDGKWFGVTYPEDKPTVVAALQKMHDAGKYPAKLWNDADAPDHS